MAAYQGERYIALQLRSILEQLAPGDEVVVVDDCSTDNTYGEVSAIDDPRIVLIRNTTNRGVLRTFEAALSRARGQIILLSDQDDIWLPGKVDATLSAFGLDPQLMLLTSDAILIDEHGNELERSYYAKRGKFRADLWSNLLICKFLGCTMALRMELLTRAWPFPRDTRIHHDIWLGCVNALIGGKTRYISDSLVAYRRHAENVTGRVRFSIYKRVQMRLQLILALVAFSWRAWRVKYARVSR